MLNLESRKSMGDFNLAGIFWTCFLASAVISIVRSVITNLERSPLRHIPGPLLAKLSGAWLIIFECAGKRAFYIRSLHERYGPVVRIGPNALSFASAAATQDIYVGVNVDIADTAEPYLREGSTLSPSYDGSSAVSDKRTETATPITKPQIATKTFPKAPLYELAPKSIGWMTDEAEHRANLRRVGHCFAPALLPAMELVMRAQLALLLRELDERRGVEVDVLHWSRMFMLDTAGHLFVGKSINALTSAAPPKFLHYMDTAIHAWFLQGYMPRTFAMLQRLPFKPKRLQELLESGEGVFNYGRQALNEFIARNGRKSPSRLPLARLIAGNTAQGLPPLPDERIAVEITNILFAATDTSATTLAYLFFELARHPLWYARLRAEVCAAAASAAAAPAGPTASKNDIANSNGDGVEAPTHHGTGFLSGLTYAALQGLPVLNAVLWETMRLYPVAPGSLRRSVPRGGAPVTGAGPAWLPAGTQVSVAPFVLQRTADVFPEPDVWEPARWLALASAPTVSLAATAAAKAGRRGLTGDGEGGRVGEDALTIYEDDAMRAHMLVFSRGVRTCVGKGIALMQLKFVAAALAQHFRSVGLADEATVEDMKMTDAFILVPKGKKCRLVFQ